ncbi:MAG: HD domain-containing protein [Candidatus Hodarchaeales archaeon]
MKSLPNYTECISFLLNQSTPINVVNHVIFTTQTALQIAKKIKKKKILLNCELILAGAMFHDIGRCRSHHLNHGIIGANLLRQHKFAEALARIAENHLFGGITDSEALKLGLPFQNYIPLTLEEKIVTYADNISKGDSLLDIDEVISRYSKYFKRTDPILIRVKNLHKKIEILLDNK